MHQFHRHQPAHRRAGAQAGFTLVELITVILILGVLAAVALPKFADLQGKARAAKVNAVAGSIRSASALVKSVAMASSQSCSDPSAGTVSMEGTSIALAYCYPQALTSFNAGVLSAANVSSTDGWTATGTSPLVLTLDEASTPASCSISYAPAASASAPPAIGTTTSGC